MSTLRTCCVSPDDPEEEIPIKHLASLCNKQYTEQNPFCTFELRHRIASNQCLMLSSCVVDTQERSDFVFR